MYFNTTQDGAGGTLDGARQYTMRFAPGTLPEVRGFWSISMCDPTFNFTPNPIDRFFVVMRTYIPGPEIVAQRWAPPAIVEVAR